MVVHAALHADAAVLVPCVGAEGDDGYLLRVLPIHGPDSAGGLVAVHDRHLDVHQHQVKVPQGTVCDNLHRVRAVGDGLHQESGVLQHCLRQQTVDFDVLHQ